MRWNPENIEWLINNYPKYGKNYCAQYLNIEAKYISYKAHSLHLKWIRPNFIEGDKKRCKKCQELKVIDDFREQRVNKKLYLRHICKKCDIEKQNQVLLPEEQINNIVSLYKDGLSCVDISERLNLNRRLITKYLKKHVAIRNRNEVALLKGKQRIGERSGKLTIIDRTIESTRGWWYCKCDCGNVIKLSLQRLAKPKNFPISCGCISKAKGKDSRLWGGHGDISLSFFNNCKIAAESRKFHFAITIEYIWDLFIKQERKCCFTGLPLFFGKNHKSEKTASLDRIDSSKGYIEGNVQWCHKWVNILKKNMPEPHFFAIIKAIYENKHLNIINDFPSLDVSLAKVSFPNIENNK